MRGSPSCAAKHGRGCPGPGQAACAPTACLRAGASAGTLLARGLDARMAGPTLLSLLPRRGRPAHRPLQTRPRPGGGAEEAPRARTPSFPCTLSPLCTLTPGTLTPVHTHSRAHPAAGTLDCPPCPFEKEKSGYGVSVVRTSSRSDLAISVGVLGAAGGPPSPHLRAATSGDCLSSRAGVPEACKGSARPGDLSLCEELCRANLRASV